MPLSHRQVGPTGQIFPLPRGRTGLYHEIEHRPHGFPGWHALRDVSLLNSTLGHV